MKHNCLIYSRRTKPTSDHRQRYASNCNHAMQKAKPNNHRKRCSNYNRLAKCNHMKREPKTSNHRRARTSTHRKLRSLFCISLTQQTAKTKPVFSMELSKRTHSMSSVSTCHPILVCELLIVALVGPTQAGAFVRNRSCNCSGSNSSR